MANRWGSRCTAAEPRDYPAIGLSMTTTIVPSFSLAVMDDSGTAGFDQR